MVPPTRFLNASADYIEMIKSTNGNMERARPVTSGGFFLNKTENYQKARHKSGHIHKTGHFATRNYDHRLEDIQEIYEKTKPNQVFDEEKRDVRKVAGTAGDSRVKDANFSNYFSAK